MWTAQEVTNVITAIGAVVAAITTLVHLLMSARAQTVNKEGQQQILEKTEVVHTLVNDQMSVALKNNAQLASKVADIEPTRENVQIAIDATKVSDDRRTGANKVPVPE